jgi:Excalibur calcium-binding domain
MKILSILLVGASLVAAPAVLMAAPSNAQQTGTYYRNCAEARAAGAAPIYRGQPGYAPHLDRDRDGIACE